MKQIPKDNIMHKNITLGRSQLVPADHERSMHAFS